MVIYANEGQHCELHGWKESQRHFLYTLKPLGLNLHGPRASLSMAAVMVIGCYGSCGLQVVSKGK